VGADEQVVVLATGSGLKDVASVMKATGQPLTVAPDLNDVRRALGQEGYR
jgi:threonine synthase